MGSLPFRFISPVHNRRALLTNLFCQVAAASVDDPAFSDEEEQAQIPSSSDAASSEQHEEPRLADLSPTAVQSEAGDATSRIASMSSADYYFYYQGKYHKFVFNLYSICIHFVFNLYV